MSRFVTRMWRASLLERNAYEEVEHDTSANAQAFGVVLLSSLAAGIGAWENSSAAGLVWHTVVSVVGWVVWAYTTYFIGTRFLPHADTVADPGQLLRTIGFSSAPGILRVAMLVSPLALGVFVVATLWMLVAMVVAVRQALDYPGTLRAAAVCAVGFPVYALSLAASILLLGPWPV
jgi:hypothetical protein